MTAAEQQGRANLPAPSDTEYRNRVLEMLVAGARLPDILDTLVHGMELQRPGALCSLMLLDGSGQHFEQVISHGPGHSSAGLPPCCAQPVRTVSGEVLGSFAIYYREQRSPDAADLALIQQCAALACIAIEKDREARKLRDSEARYRTLVEWSPDPVLVHQLGTILYANPAALKAFGAADASALVGRQTRTLVHPDFLAQQSARMQALLDGVAIEPMTQSRFLRLDGTPFDVEVQGTCIAYQGQNAIHVVLRDITQRKLAQDRLQLAAGVFSHAREGILITDADTRIVDVNQAFTDITGYSREEMLGLQARIFRLGPHSEIYFEQLWRDLKAEGHWSGEIWTKRKNGEPYAEMVTISAIVDGQGTVRNYVVLLVDITPMKTYQKQLEDLAHFDALTHLPNRLLLADRLRQAMSQTQRRKQTLAVVFLDLDGFKAVNDRHGHDVGDELLIMVSQRMKGALREGDTLARLGGDEFVAVLVDLHQSEDAEPVLERLLQAAAEPVAVGQALLQVSASMGIAVYPRDGTHADLLLRRADQSMYQAKQAGRNRYHFFNEDNDSAPAG